MTGQEGDLAGVWGVTWVSTEQEAVSLRPHKPIRIGRVLGCNNPETVVQGAPWNSVTNQDSWGGTCGQQGVQVWRLGQPR